MKTIGLTIAVAAICSAATTAAFAAENWDMPMAYPADNYHTENAQMFADAVDECTGGELKITLHAGGSLFKGSEIKRAVQVGEAQIGERLLSAHANENAVFGYDSVPFLATSFEASDSLRAAAEPTLTKVMQAQGLTPLYSVPWPPQGLYFAKPIESVADMSGIKFRAYNAATARVAELAGMVPTQIEAAELNLGETEQGCLTSLAAEAQERGLATAAELADGFLKTLAENGMSVEEAGDELAAELAGIGETMTGEWLESAGEDGAAIVDAFKAQ